MNGFKKDVELLKVDYLCTLSTAPKNTENGLRMTTKFCILCNKNFVNHYDYLDHINEHLNTFFYDRIKWLKISDIIDAHSNNNMHSDNLNKAEPDCDKGNSLNNRFIVNVVQIRDTTIECELKNVYRKKIDVQHIFMYHPTNIILYIDQDKWPRTVDSEEKIQFFIHRNLFNQDHHKYPIYIHFKINNVQNIEYWEFYVSKTLEIERRKAITNDTEITNIVNQREKHLKLNNLKMYDPRAEVRKLYHQDFKAVEPISVKESKIVKLIDELEENKINSNNNNILNETNYLSTLLLFADIEDICNEIMIQAYNRKNEKLISCGGNYIINVPNLSESRPSILVYDRLTIHSNCLPKPVNGIIWDIQREHIVVQFKQKIDTTLPYDVKFMCNRTSLRMEKYAIELMGQKELTQFMFPSHEPSSVQQNANAETSVLENFEWYNESVSRNMEQQTAIKKIFQGTAHPHPYILFGPPGTGKTTTLVESILQLWKNKPESRILIVSTSNFACNVISKRILDFLPKSEILRLFSKSQEVAVNKIDGEVIEASNLESLIHYYPALSELYAYRIIVATLTTSGRLIQGNFHCKFFTHLFIDECGSCTEGASLIPIAGLISLNKSIKANIILAGDPLQLGPVIQSQLADRLGYGISLIERLMKFPIYKKDGETRIYNANFITKLRSNYRSHKDILHISNDLFYEGELKALGSPAVTSWALNWKHLANPKFPIVFHSIYGKVLQDKDSPSLYNLHEVDRVIRYLNLLVNKKINGKIITQKDIGVITPYRKQCQKIRHRCDGRKWTDVEVASVEAFQGNEKNVIILSTVRSNVKTLGFLNNERRLNVALTRAQGLLIIVGDPVLLRRDANWRHFINFCKENKAVIGN